VGLVLAIEGIESNTMRVYLVAMCVDSVNSCRQMWNAWRRSKKTKNTAALYMFILGVCIYIESEDTLTDIQDTFNATSPVISTSFELKHWDVRSHCLFGGQNSWKASALQTTFNRVRQLSHIRD
jgi:hypothetical protein